MRLSQREKLQAAKRKQFENVYLKTWDDLLMLILDGSRPATERSINPTQRDFIYDNTRLLLLSKTDKDQPEDFKGGFEFDDAFRKPFLPPSKLPASAPQPARKSGA